MSTRRRLPPGAKWVTLPSGEKRVEAVADLGSNPATGRRRQSRRRFVTAEEAIAWHAETTSAVHSGTYVHKSRTTVEEAIDGWLVGRRSIRPSTLASYRDALLPVAQRLGTVPLQHLSRRHVDELVNALQAGTLPRADGQPRRPWKPRTVRLMLGLLESVLDDAVREGLLPRNVVTLVDRPKGVQDEMQTWTAAEVAQFHAAIGGDRDAVAWLLALYGLRRGEIAGLRWDDVGLEAGTLRIRGARVAVGRAAIEGDPKSERGMRLLPLTPDLHGTLRATRKRQAAERLVAGSTWQESGYVVTDPLGQPLHPPVLSTRWNAAVRRARLRTIRLHDARHTAATLMHMRGVPTAVISAWLGHSSPAFTMRTYVHSQNDALAIAAEALATVTSA